MQTSMSVWVDPDTYNCRRMDYSYAVWRYVFWQLTTVRDSNIGRVESIRGGSASTQTTNGPAGIK
jgi:hypothetical protein